MERLTFDGNFCDIALCSEVRYGSFCEALREELEHGAIDLSGR